MKILWSFGKRVTSTLLIATFVIIVAILMVPSYAFITLTTSGVNYAAWVDKGIVFGAGPLKAYYPSVVYNTEGFPDGDGPDYEYKMWYGTEYGKVGYAYSNDGITWTDYGLVVGGVEYHAKVIYDANRFEEGEYGPYYKMWFWNTACLYDIRAIGYAESRDGINWYNVQTITQGTPMLVTGIWPDWNRGSYGPAEVIYIPSGSPSLDSLNPFNNKYVMYYDGTTGGAERVGLAVSTDGKHWVAYDGNGDGEADIILDGTQIWELITAERPYVGFGSIIKDKDGYHFLYSGGRGVMHHGIGLAHSTDGISWSKYPGNPIFNVADTTSPQGYRSKRAYTPSIIYDGSLELKMYYSAVSSDGDYAIGSAILTLPDTIPPTIESMSVSPSVLWPPNRKMGDVTISGIASDMESGVRTVKGEVIDEYGLVEPIATETFIPVPGKISFSLTVQLQAWRNGNDLDGRVYTIKITVIDGAGNSATAEATVIVPHDQRGNQIS